MKSGKSAVFAVALLLSAGAARADVEISSKATANMSCDAGVCTATAQKAVLNVGDLATMLASGDVAVKTGSLAKDIGIDQPLTWSSTSRLTLDAQRSLTVKKAMSVTGTGALTLTTNDGGSGGDLLFENKGSVTFWDTSSSLIINGQGYTLVKDIATLAADIAANPSGFYALANSYDAKHDRFDKVPISTPFSGTFEGLGQAISHVKIRRDIKCGIEHGSGLRCEGFFNSVAPAGVVRDISLKKLRLSSFDTDYAGGLIGANFGMVQSASVDGVVGGSAAYIGGAVGDNNGIISNSSAAVTVTAPTSGAAGGLVGGSGNLIVNSHATGSVSGLNAGGLAGGATGVLKSYATGPVTGSANVGGLLAGGSEVMESYATGSVAATRHRAKVGGLIGTGNEISNCYATGAVHGMENGDIGGLVGEGRAVKDSYSIGAVTAQGEANAGGLIGRNFKRQNTDDYWDIDTSGIAEGCGRGNCENIIGLTSDQLKSALPAGFDPRIWGHAANINDGFPYLLAVLPK